MASSDKFCLAECCELSVFDFVLQLEALQLFLLDTFSLLSPFQHLLLNVSCIAPSH